MGSKTLFNAVFIRPEQVVRFLLCSSDHQLSRASVIYVCLWGSNAGYFIFVSVFFDVPRAVSQIQPLNK